MPHAPHLLYAGGEPQDALVCWTSLLFALERQAAFGQCLAQQPHCFWPHAVQLKQVRSLQFRHPLDLTPRSYPLGCCRSYPHVLSFFSYWIVIPPQEGYVHMLQHMVPSPRVILLTLPSTFRALAAPTADTAPHFTANFHFQPTPPAGADIAMLLTPTLINRSWAPNQ
jgi:hypothetical protein